MADVTGPSIFYVSLLAGGIAGTCADVILFPLDTIKTRLQSKNGFWSTGGFRNIYSGILPAAAGSAPSAATFFVAYELVKYTMDGYISSPPLVHMIGASLGEMVSCIVRVPFEVIKQRRQINRNMKPLQIFQHTIRTEGLLGLYRGYVSTVSREIPFSLIQYPVWEYLKFKWSAAQEDAIRPWQGAVCGAIAGGVAASLTTPLDVVKTRVMLAQKNSKEVRVSIPRLLLMIGQQEGLRGLFAGYIPRVMWISLGGFIFLGAYDKSKDLIMAWSTR